MQALIFQMQCNFIFNAMCNASIYFGCNAICDAIFYFECNAKYDANFTLNAKNFFKTSKTLTFSFQDETMTDNTRKLKIFQKCKYVFEVNAKREKEC
jgi:hypothetical protein